MNKDVKEILLNPRRGGTTLAVVLLLLVVAFAAIIGGAVLIEDGSANGSGLVLGLGIALLVCGIVGFIVLPVYCAGFKIVNPNEALVLTFFGKYYGTIAREGFFHVNPFCSAINPAKQSSLSAAPASKDGSAEITQLINVLTTNKKLSLKAITLNNPKQKVNDLDGNPIEIGVVVIWRIKNTAKAVFCVDNYMSFINTQTDSAIRHVARLYPYDVNAEGDEKSLRASAQEIANVLREELQQRVDMAGLEVLEARISHLAYAQEIAAAMLQRQQASAIIAARQKIVEGAVGMVEMALNKLSDNGIVTLDDERKAQMVSNLLVVLCGNRDAQPVVSTGSIY